MKGKLQDKKLDFTIKKLKLKKARKKKKKFLAIQLDGVSHKTLVKAMKKGYVPFIRKLIESGEKNLERYNCGLPSGTPAIQSAIFYGDNKNIPAFRLYDKKIKEYYSFSNPAHVKKAHDRFYSNKKGILEGGASYCNMFHGGADRSIMTLSTFTKKKYFKRLKESDLWLLMLLNPLSLVRVVYYSSVELIIEALSFTWNAITRWFTGGKGIYGARIPFRRFILDAIFIEIATIGTLLDVKRNLSKIYITYPNYDDIAHLRGPESLEAMFALRGLDRRVKKIYKQAEKKGYDVYMLSDHGQIPGIPFKKLNGMSLAKFIQRAAKVKSFGLDEGARRNSLLRAAMIKTIYYLDYFSGPLKWLVGAFARSTIKLVRPKNYPFNLNDKKSIFVVDSCNLATVYFNFSTDRVTMGQIEKKYPDLIAKLLNNKGIGAVMGLTDIGTVIQAKEGRLTLNEDGSITTEGKNFLKRFGDTKTLIKQFKAYSKKNMLGDLILFGEMNDGLSTSFTDHVGCHGGMGGESMHPFFISKEKHDMSRVIDAKALHNIFKRY